MDLPPPPPLLSQCDYCGANNIPIKVFCSCGASYCSTGCRIDDWNKHIECSETQEKEMKQRIEDMKQRREQREAAIKEQREAAIKEQREADKREAAVMERWKRKQKKDADREAAEKAAEKAAIAEEIAAEKAAKAAKAKVVNNNKKKKDKRRDRANEAKFWKDASDRYLSNATMDAADNSVFLPFFESRRGLIDFIPNDLKKINELIKEIILKKVFTREDEGLFEFEKEDEGLFEFEKQGAYDEIINEFNNIVNRNPHECSLIVHVIQKFYIYMKSYHRNSDVINKLLDRLMEYTKEYDDKSTVMRKTYTAILNGTIFKEPLDLEERLAERGAAEAKRGAAKAMRQTALLQDDSVVLLSFLQSRREDPNFYPFQNLRELNDTIDEILRKMFPNEIEYDNYINKIGEETKSIEFIEACRIITEKIITHVMEKQDELIEDINILCEQLQENLKKFLIARNNIIKYFHDIRPPPPPPKSFGGNAKKKSSKRGVGQLRTMKNERKKRKKEKGKSIKGLVNIFPSLRRRTFPLFPFQ